MAKTIIKEICIALLLLIAIALILGILFYDYIPNNKTVPIKVQAYEMPEEIQTELSEAIPEGQNIITTLYIDDTDLNAYESTNDYDKGKANPFAEYVEQKTSNEDTNTINNNADSTAQSSKDENEVYITTPGKNY